MVVLLSWVTAFENWYDIPIAIVFKAHRYMNNRKGITPYSV